MTRKDLILSDEYLTEMVENIVIYRGDIKDIRKNLVGFLKRYRDEIANLESEIAKEPEVENVDFIQVRDLTDEEWLELPKEEILKLYKNCYAMLLRFSSLSVQGATKEPSKTADITDDDIELMAIKSSLGRLVNALGDEVLDVTFCDGFIEGAKAMRDGEIKHL